LLIGKILSHNKSPFNVDAYKVSVSRTPGTAALCEASVKVSVDLGALTVKVDGKHSRLSKLKSKDGLESHESIGTGDGPVNALDSALRNALTKFFPQLKKITLTDYKVRILDSVAGLGDIFQAQIASGNLSEAEKKDAYAAIEKLRGTAAKTRVLIESTDGQREWGTVGVSENIIEASLEALVDSMEFALLKK
jgi:2-isopropylmalate synthase